MKRKKIKTHTKDIRVLLHNIRSTHNVGSIFRTADAGGVRAVYFSGYTPTPYDQFGKKRNDIAKTALGAEESIHSEQVDPNTLIAHLRAEGFQIFALEQSEDSVDYKDVKVKEKVLLIVGNEVRGISSSLRAKADTTIEIPMHGTKESLNVSVAFGIALFQIIK
jgi:tRNA G18 (ribose-2'-O)-methylase SpoU